MDGSGCHPYLDGGNGSRVILLDQADHAIVEYETVNVGMCLFEGGEGAVEVYSVGVRATGRQQKRQKSRKRNRSAWEIRAHVHNSFSPEARGSFLRGIFVFRVAAVAAGRNGRTKASWKS